MEPSVSAVSKSQRVEYACGFCAEEGIHKTCTRRNDLRRHIENFHNSNAMWYCQRPGCDVVFDWQTAYHNHLRNAHGRSQMNMNEAKVTLCKQTVFACGFEQCTQVFETNPEGDGDATLKDYSSHIVKHLEDKSSSGQWSYSTRLRNLLRQSRVVGHWERACQGTDSSQLRWEPQSSIALRKRLETQHLENLEQLIHELVLLGTSKSDGSELPARLEPPYKHSCPSEAHRSPSARGSPSRDLRQDAPPQHSSTKPFAVETNNMEHEYSTLGNWQSTQFEPSMDGQPENGRSAEYRQVPFEGQPGLHSMDSSHMFYEAHMSAAQYGAQPIMAGSVSPGPSPSYGSVPLPSCQPQYDELLAASGYPSSADVDMGGTSSTPPYGDVSAGAHGAHANGWATGNSSMMRGNPILVQGLDGGMAMAHERMYAGGVYGSPP